MKKGSKEYAREIESMSPPNQLRFAADLLDEIEQLGGGEKLKFVNLAWVVVARISAELGIAVHAARRGRVEAIDRRGG